MKMLPWENAFARATRNLEYKGGRHTAQMQARRQLIQAPKVHAQMNKNTPKEILIKELKIFGNETKKNESLRNIAYENSL